MTTAHRPTWKSAVGGEDQGGFRLHNPTRQYSSRDLPGFLDMKKRQDGQMSHQDVQNIDFKQDLLHRERINNRNDNFSFYAIKIPHNKEPSKQINISEDNPLTQIQSSPHKKKRVFPFSSTFPYF
jgi:protein CWC15